MKPVFPTEKPVVLTIAGSDPSGGAGIQADLRTFAALGVVGVSVITAITVQNSLGVQSVHPVPAAVLAAQLEAIFSDIRIAAVKIGMLGGAGQVRVVADALRKYAPPYVVLDPVLASTGGVALLDAEGSTTLLAELFPLCDLVTPNITEAGILSGLPIETVGEMHTAAHLILESFRVGADILSKQGATIGSRKAGVLIKGGHLPGSAQAIDVLIEGSSFQAESRRIETPHTHGTGCLLSSALAVYLAQGLSKRRALLAAKSVLNASLNIPVITGQGRGYPDVSAGVLNTSAGMSHTDRLSLLRGVYVVTDSELRPNQSPLETVKAALAGGAGTIQLREKRLPLRQLIGLARECGKELRGTATLLIVNDRVDVALASSADGVHLGPGDMRPKDARRLLGPDNLVGVSVATVEEAEIAAPYASYFGVGAIFGSRTKLDAGEAIGVGRIREIKEAYPDIPLVAIGGINLENIVEVAAAGADAAAVVSAVVCAPEIDEAIRELLLRFNAGKASR